MRITNKATAYRVTIDRYIDFEGRRYHLTAANVSEVEGVWHVQADGYAVDNQERHKGGLLRFHGSDVPDRLRFAIIDFCRAYK